MESICLYQKKIFFHKLKIVMYKKFLDRQKIFYVLFLETALLVPKTLNFNH